MQATLIETERLRLRPWKDTDLALFAAMNADPRVREFFPSLLTREESDTSVARFRESQEQYGFCFFAAELRATKDFIGFVGIQPMKFPLPSVADPAVEIGWRLTPAVWRRGLATEGARAVLDFAFRHIRLREVIAIAVPSNLPSRRVMEKLGMTRDSQDDFDHPKIADGHPLQRHVLYRILQKAWLFADPIAGLSDWPAKT